MNWHMTASPGGIPNLKIVTQCRNLGDVSTESTIQRVYNLRLQHVCTHDESILFKYVNLEA